MESIDFGHLKARFLPVAGGLLVCAIAVPAMAQGAPDTPMGVPEDWSHRHVIHSNPDTREEAAAKGTLEQWSRKADDPRFVLQLEKKVARLQKAGDAEDDALVAEAGGGRKFALATSAAAPNAKKKPGEQLHRDWSNVMGGASGSGSARNYPAKFTFTTSTKSCADDFVVFTTSALGATGSGAQAFGIGVFSAAAATTPTADTVTITNGTRSLTLTASGTVNTGLFFQPGGSRNTSAANLAAAITRNGGTVGVTATNSAGAIVRITAMTHGAGGNAITLADTSQVFTTSGGNLFNGSGTPGQPTIFALNQLYADTTGNGGCQTSTQPVPATFWSYNTGTGAVVDLSPVLSFFDNGAQVAFMQRSGAVSSLVLLKWSSSAPGTIGAPTAPASVTPANYRTCTVPCMTVMALAGNPDNTNSAPYVDYAGDILYVGDDTGKVHKFSGIFQGTPAEAGAPWPVQVAATTSIMSSPVFDGAGTVYIGSNGPGIATGNRMHWVDSATGAVTSSGVIGSVSTANGIRDAPILDASSGKVYAFQGAFTNLGPDAVGNLCPNICNTVFQFAANFAGGNTGSKVFVGQSDDSNNLQRTLNAGAFDDEYWSSGGLTGNLYVCGSRPTVARRPNLWKISIAGGSFVARTQGPLLATGDTTDGCSPPTVFKNGGTEHLYVSVSNNDAAIGGTACTSPFNGCVYMYTLASSFGTVFDTTSTNSTTNAAARYLSVSTSTALNATEGSVDTSLTGLTAGTYKGMTITQSVATPAATTNTFTLRVDSVSLPITCSIPAGGTTCSDTSHAVGLLPGNFIDVQVTRTGSDTTATFRVQLTADVSWNEVTPASAALNATGGTGGIIIDNAVSGGGSQVYYSTRGGPTNTPIIPGNAVQASQAGLN